MKKSQATIGLAVILLLVAGMSIAYYVPALAQSGSTTASAVASNLAPGINDQIDVTIAIDVSAVDPSDNAAGSFTSTLDWNPAVLTYNSNSGLKNGFLGIVNDSSRPIAFNGVNISGATGKTDLLTITFDVVGLGSADLDLRYKALSSATTFASLLSILTVHEDNVQATSPTAANLAEIQAQPALASSMVISLVIGLALLLAVSVWMLYRQHRASS